MALSREDIAAVQGLASRLKVDPGTLGGLFEMESGMNPNIWGGAGGKYRGLIQFGPEARKEVGLPSGPMSVAQQIPFVERYFQQRGFQPGKHGATELYRTVLVGNPHQGGTDSWGTNSDKAAQRMLPGGDLYERAAKKLGGGGGGATAASPAAMTTTATSGGGSDPLLAGFEGYLKSITGGRAGQMAMAGADNPLLTAIPGVGFAEVMTGLQQAPSQRMAAGMGFFNSMLGSMGIDGGAAPAAAAGAALGGVAKSPGLQFLDSMKAALGVGQTVPVTTPPPSATSGNASGGVIKVGRVARPEEDVFPTSGPHLDVRVQEPDGRYINPANARSLLRNLVARGKPLYYQSDAGEWKSSYGITSPFGYRNTGIPGASTNHKGEDHAIDANSPLEWHGGGKYSFSGGVGTIELPDGRRVKLLHTRPS